MCKRKMQKAGDEKVTNRRGRAFIQKIITPFKHYQRIQTCSYRAGAKARTLITVCMANIKSPKTERQYSRV